jgi:hypothetical protein
MQIVHSQPAPMMMIRLTSSDKGSITMRVRHLVIIRTPEGEGVGEEGTPATAVAIAATNRSVS